MSNEMEKTIFPTGTQIGGNERFALIEYPNSIYIIQSRPGNAQEDENGGYIPPVPFMKITDVGRALSYLREQGIKINQLVAFNSEGGATGGIVVLAESPEVRPVSLNKDKQI